MGSGNYVYNPVVGYPEQKLLLAPPVSMLTQCRVFVNIKTTLGRGDGGKGSLCPSSLS